MESFLAFLQDLANPSLSFLTRALIVSLLSAVLCALIGTHVTLRGMAFIGDAVAHAVFPGLAIAFVLGGSLVVGGMIGGISIAVIVAVLSQQRRVGEDSVIGVVYAAAFAIGLIVLSRSRGYSGSLTSFLSGSLTGVTSTDVVVTTVATVVLVATLFLAHRAWVAIALDREFAVTRGVPVMWLDILLSVAIACAIVVSVRTVGNILVLALLITPAATARLLCNRLVPMMCCAAGIGMLSTFLGIYVSWTYDTPAGATIVVVSTIFFVTAWVVRTLPGFAKVSGLRTSVAPAASKEDSSYQSGAAAPVNPQAVG